MSFTQIQAPNYPHLIEQLEFLANVVEDLAKGGGRSALCRVGPAAVFVHLRAPAED